MFQHFKTLTIVFAKKRFVSLEYLVTSNSTSGRPWGLGTDSLVQANVKTARTKCQFYNTEQASASRLHEMVTRLRQIKVLQAVQSTKKIKVGSTSHYPMSICPCVIAALVAEAAVGLWLVEADHVTSILASDWSGQRTQ